MKGSRTTEISRIRREIRRAETARDAALRTQDTAAFKAANKKISTLLPQLRDHETKQARYGDVSTTDRSRRTIDG